MVPLDDHSRRLIVVVGASGSGKDSVLGAWLAALPAADRPHRAQRTITRPAGDPSEVHEAIDEAGFIAARNAGDFMFAWQAHGLHYGLRHGELAPLARGQWVVMNGSRAHLGELRGVAPQARVVEVVASPDLRSARLSARARESDASLELRLARSTPDCAPELRIQNDGDLAASVARLQDWWLRLREAPGHHDVTGRPYQSGLRKPHSPSP